MTTREKTTNNSGLCEGSMPKYIEAAVEWWGKAIANPKFDKGDSSREGSVASLLALLGSMERKIDENQLNLFKKVLAELIIEEIEDYGSSYLKVDYHPERALSIAADKAGINTDIVRFPWKTHMIVTKEKVTVSCGYGAEEKILYLAK